MAEPIPFPQGSTASTPPPPHEREVTHFAGKSFLLEQYRRDDGFHVFACSRPDGEVITRLENVPNRGTLFRPLYDALIRDGTVTLPPQPDARPQDARVLFEDLLAFVQGHVTWSSEFRVGAVAYIMTSWIYERFQFLPYFQFIGPPGSGKSRSEEVLDGLCYHSAFLSLPTCAVIYRLIAACHSTLLIDEVDRELRGEMRDILRNGTSRSGKVLRCAEGGRWDEDFKLRSYPCFSPKVYAGQEPIDDSALESRIIQENMATISAEPHIGPELSKEFQHEARKFQARLLSWALGAYWNIQTVDPGGEDSRQRQVFLPLFTVTPPNHRHALVDLMKRQRTATFASRRDSLDGEVVAALRKLENPGMIRPKEIARAVCGERGVDFDKQSRHPEHVSSAKAGHVLKRLGITDGDRDKAGRFYRVSSSTLQKLYRTYLPQGETGAM